jgi:hypothetical protein
LLKTGYKTDKKAGYFTPSKIKNDEKMKKIFKNPKSCIACSLFVL